MGESENQGHPLTGLGRANAEARMNDRGAVLRQLRDTLRQAADAPQLPPAERVVYLRELASVLRELPANRVHRHGGRRASVTDLPPSWRMAAARALLNGETTAGVRERMAAAGCPPERLPGWRGLARYQTTDEYLLAASTRATAEMEMVAIAALDGMVTDAHQLQQRNNAMLFAAQSKWRELESLDPQDPATLAKRLAVEHYTSGVVSIGRILNAQTEAEYKRRCKELQQLIIDLKSKVGAIPLDELVRHMDRILEPAKTGATTSQGD